MKKAEKIQALNIVSTNDVKVTKIWWSPFRNVIWEVVDSTDKLIDEQYSYLTRNGFLEPKTNIKKGEVIILTISKKGQQSLRNFNQKNKLTL